jgi:hypothetical protein
MMILLILFFIIIHLFFGLLAYWMFDFELCIKNIILKIIIILGGLLSAILGFIFMIFNEIFLD